MEKITKINNRGSIYQRVQNLDNWLRLCYHAIFISLHLSKLESTKKQFFPSEKSLANSRHTHAHSHTHTHVHTHTNTHTHANIPWGRLMFRSHSAGRRSTDMMILHIFFSLICILDL